MASLPLVPEDGLVRTQDVGVLMPRVPRLTCVVQFWLWCFSGWFRVSISPLAEAHVHEVLLLTICNNPNTIFTRRGAFQGQVLFADDPYVSPGESHRKGVQGSDVESCSHRERGVVASWRGRSRLECVNSGFA